MAFIGVFDLLDTFDLEPQFVEDHGVVLVQEALEVLELEFAQVELVEVLRVAQSSYKQEEERRLLLK